MDMPCPSMKIHAAMAAIQRDIEPVAKGRKNQQQGYSFRGIDDVYYAVNRVMAKHGVFMVSEIMHTETSERKSNSGGTLFCRVLHVRYRFIAEDGSSVATEVIGEGFDSGDKAAPKALSVAQKYAILQAFMVPTSEPKDIENDNFDVVPSAQDRPASTPAKAPAPAPATADDTAFPGHLRCRECGGETRKIRNTKTNTWALECQGAGCGFVEDTNDVASPASQPAAKPPITGPTAPSKPPAAAKSVQDMAIDLGNEVMRRVGGDADAASQLLVEITKNEKPVRGRPFSGFKTVGSMKFDWQVTGAWERLRAHARFGDKPASAVPESQGF